MSEEIKISLDDLEDIFNEDSNSKTRKRLNFQTIFAALVLNWQWFVLSLIICVCGALIYLRYTEPVYQVSARMLIKEEHKRGNNSQMLANIEDLGFLSNSSGIENEVEVLQSRVLLRDVVKDLKLYAEYRREGHLHDVIVNGERPVNVDLDPQHLDSLDIKLLEKNEWLRMRIWREETGYVIEGNTMVGKSESSAFRCRAKTLPASFKTSLGTVTMTAAPGKLMDYGEVYLATIRPPMQVATAYLKALTIEPTSKVTSIAMITLQDKDYHRGMDVLRQLVVCYNRQANADKNEVAVRTEEFINERMSKINAELGSTESTIQQFKQQNAVTSLADAAQSVQMSNQFSARLAEAEAQVQIIDYMRDYVNNPSNRYQIIPSSIGINDRATSELINNYNQAVQDRNRLLKSASEEAMQVRTLTATIDELQQSIQTALLQARRTADINRQGVQAQFAKFQGRISAAPMQERVLNQEGRQQDVKSTLYMLLLQKREENSIAMAATADNGRLIDEPLFEGQISPKKSLTLLGAVAAGFMTPALILWLISLFRYKVEGHDDVERLTPIPIIADVPVASEMVKQRTGIVVKADKNDLIDEVFRSLRTNVQFMLTGEQKVICVTSSTSGEGKSFNAANLAMSFALLGKRTLLCGLDIRKPALGKLFSVSDRSKGITTLLKQTKVTWEDLQAQLLPSGVNENLDLLLAGPVPPNPTELLARENFADIMRMLRQQYDYIILDTAPVGLVTDTIQIGQQADMTIFVLRADYTPKSSIRQLNELAKGKKLPNLGIVINGIDLSRRKYGYYYGYGNYGKYGRYSYASYGSYGQYADSHYVSKDDDSIKK